MLDKHGTGGRSGAGSVRPVSRSSSPSPAALLYKSVKWRAGQPVVTSVTRRKASQSDSEGNCYLGSVIYKDFSPWIIIIIRSPARMKLVHVALLYLGSLTFLGVDAARLDLAPESKRKWTKWALSRVKRDAIPPVASSRQVQPLVRTQDVKEDPRVSHPSAPEDARIRVKRYRQSVNGFPHFQAMRLGCRFGTCTIQQLAHQIYQLTDKDKDGAAPVSKISPLGYGRRRRSVPAPSRTQSLWLAPRPSPRDGRNAAAPGRPGRLQAQLRAPSLRT